MSKKQALEELPILLTKAHICKCLDMRMKVIYKKIFTKKIITKNFGFKTVEEFKRVRLFNLEQSNQIKKFLKKALEE